MKNIFIIFITLGLLSSNPGLSKDSSITLIGTITNSDPSRSIAFLRDLNSKETILASVGSKFRNFTVTAIQRKKVSLKSVNTIIYVYHDFTIDYPIAPLENDEESEEYIELEDDYYHDVDLEEYRAEEYRLLNEGRDPDTPAIPLPDIYF